MYIYVYILVHTASYWCQKAKFRRIASFGQGKLDANTYTHTHTYAHTHTYIHAYAPTLQVYGSDRQRFFKFTATFSAHESVRIDTSIVSWPSPRAGMYACMQVYLYVYNF